MLKLFSIANKQRIFQDSFTSEPDTRKVIVVPAEQVQTLLNARECQTEQIAGKSYKILRFLLRTDNKLVFAHEGTGDETPPHWRMASNDQFDAQCLTAGNVLFDEQGELAIINNKSGDFKPPFNSLQFVFPALLEAPIMISDSLIIQELNRNNLTNQEHVVTKEAVADFCTQPHLSLPIPEDCSMFSLSAAPQLDDRVQLNTSISQEKAAPLVNEGHLASQSGSSVDTLVNNSLLSIIAPQKLSSSQSMRLNPSSFFYNTSAAERSGSTFNIQLTCTQPHNKSQP